MTALGKFNEITASIIVERDCTLGKMMSSPGVKYRNKVFAFLWDDKMGFKLGREYDIDQHGLYSWEHLSPFKTKPPLYAWYIVGPEDLDKWEELSFLALSKIKSDLR